MIPTSSIREIQAAVCREFGVTMVDLISDRRGQRYSVPRGVAMWLANRATLLSVADIAREFRRDPTTVLHAIGRVDAAMARDSVMADRVGALLQSVEPGETVDERRARIRVVA